jgi:hypothetical protein
MHWLQPGDELRRDVQRIHNASAVIARHLGQHAAQGRGAPYQI